MAKLLHKYEPHANNKVIFYNKKSLFLLQNTPKIITFASK